MQHIIKYDPAYLWTEVATYPLSAFLGHFIRQAISRLRAVRLVGRSKSKCACAILECSTNFDVGGALNGDCRLMVQLQYIAVKVLLWWCLCSGTIILCVIHATFSPDSYLLLQRCQFPRAVSHLPLRPGVGGSSPGFSSFLLGMTWSGEGLELG